MKGHVTQANEKRMVDTFIKLVKIPSPSRKEGKVAAELIKIFKGLGCSVYVDQAGKKLGGETGNIIAKFPGTAAGEPFLLAAHMDTVTPCINIKPIVEKTRIRTDGKTILGGDCKAGISVIIEILRILKEQKLKHPPIEIVISICEEEGMLGTRELDYSKLKAKTGLVLDEELPTEAIVGAPAKDGLNVTIHGVAAHAGMSPEKGISAIEVASKAISMMKLGRIDNETTANIGIISGGTASNVVAPSVKIIAEARSRNLAKLKKQTAHIRQIFEKAVKMSAKKVDGKKISAKLEIKEDRTYPNLVIPKDCPGLVNLIKAGAQEGYKIKAICCGGGFDANRMFPHGIKAIAIGFGMRNAHSVNETLELKDFFDCLKISLATVLNSAK